MSIVASALQAPAWQLESYPTSQIVTYAVGGKHIFSDVIHCELLNYFKNAGIGLGIGRCLCRFSRCSSWIALSMDITPQVPYMM